MNTRNVNVATKHKTETGLNQHKAKCNERDKPSDNNDTIYRLLVITIQQLPEQSNILGRKRAIPSRQFFKGCLPRNLLSPFLNTLSHM